MTATKFFGVVSTIFIVGFIVFAFRQGLRVRRDDRPDRGPSVGTPNSDFTGGSDGHLP
jgi:hypothetical protein